MMQWVRSRAPRDRAGLCGQVTANVARQHVRLQGSDPQKLAEFATEQLGVVFPGAELHYYEMRNDVVLLASAGAPALPDGALQALRLDGDSCMLAGDQLCVNVVMTPDWQGVAVVAAPGTCLEDAWWVQYACSLMGTALQSALTRHQLEIRTRVLHGILPPEVSRQVEAAVASSPDRLTRPLYTQSHACVTLLFSDIVGYTHMCDNQPPSVVVDMLHGLFCRFDRLCRELGVYKVETIGDCYLVACGMDGRPDHAARAVSCGAAMCAAARAIVSPLRVPLTIRVGAHSGAVYSAVLGLDRAHLCVFGDTVNTASRMESTGVPSHVQITGVTYNRLPQVAKKLPWKSQMVTPKGKAAMQTFLIDYRFVDAAACIPDNRRSVDLAEGPARNPRQSCQF